MFRDARDGKVYKSVTIGDQVWMAENLNFEAEGSRCYKDNLHPNEAENCEKYGRLYDWSTAMGLEASYNSAPFDASANHQGICPAGWHIPSDAEWTTLTNNIGGLSTAGTKLKDSSVGGTDNYGFSALLGGYVNQNGVSYQADSYGFWWSTRTVASGGGANAYDRNMMKSKSNVRSDPDGKVNSYSVRCLQD